MTRANHHRDIADALIDEVRQRRRDLLAACDGDLARLAELVRQREADHPDRMGDPRQERGLERADGER